VPDASQGSNDPAAMAKLRAVDTAPGLDLRAMLQDAIE
jgi:hypothetical protein